MNELVNASVLQHGFLPGCGAAVLLFNRMVLYVVNSCVVIAGSFEHRHRNITEVHIIAGALRAGFLDQLAAAVVMKYRGSGRCGFLHSLSQCIDGVVHRADGSIRCNQAASYIIGKLTGCIAGNAAVGIGGNRGHLTTGDLRQLVAGRLIAEIGRTATHTAGRAVAGCIVLVTLAAVR